MDALRLLCLSGFIATASSTVACNSGDVKGLTFDFTALQTTELSGFSSNLVRARKSFPHTGCASAFPPPRGRFDLPTNRFSRL